MVTEKSLKENMDALFKIFGVNGNDIKTSIEIYLIMRGWERNKAVEYAELIGEYAKTKEPVTVVWPGE